jgi:hypothetical protein
MKKVSLNLMETTQGGNCGTLHYWTGFAGGVAVAGALTGNIVAGAVGGLAFGILSIASSECHEDTHNR